MFGNDPLWVYYNGGCACVDADKFENIEIVARSWRQSSSRYQDYLWTRDCGSEWGALGGWSKGGQ